jgi:hypothetical protein
MKIKMLILFMLVLPAIVVTQARADLVAYWPFDEGTGDVAYDYMGLNNAAMTDHTWVTPGKLGAAAISTTEDTEVDAGAGPTPTTDDLTFAWWMIDNHDSYGTLMNKSTTNSTSGYNILVRPDNEDYPLIFRIGGWQEYGGWGEECCLPTGAYNDGEWVHIACTYDSATDTATIYVNGELAPNGSLNPKVGGIAGDDGYCDGVNNADEPLYIVGSAVTGEGFTGRIDEVAIWDTALTADEVRSVYENGNMPQPGASKPDPTVGQTGVNPNTLLSWEAPAKAVDTPTYDVYFVADDPNLLALIANDIEDTFVDPTTGDLDYMRTYYWQVDAYYTEEGTSGPELYPGDIWYFTTGGLARNPSPADGDVAVWTSPTLTWTGDDWANGYKIYIGSADGVWDLVNGELITETSYTLTDLDVFDDYFWKVEVLDGNGDPILPGQVSTWSFTTGGLVAKILRDTDDFTDTSGRSHNALTEGSNPPTLVDGTASFAGSLESYLVIDPNSGNQTDLMTNRDFTWSLWLNSDPIEPVTGGYEFVSAYVVRAPIDGTWPEGSKKLVSEMGYEEVWLEFDTTADGDGTYAFVGMYDETNLLDGTWHHCAVTANAATGQVSLFMDGVMLESGTRNLTAGDDSSLITQIGRMPAGTTPVAFSGRMTDIRIYSACLPDAVVEEVYQDSHWATVVNPEDTATDITPAIVLEWLVPSGTVSQVLYFDPNGALVAAGDISVSNPLAGNVSTYDPLGIDELELETTYYWRVDTVDTFGNTWPGRTCSFTTAEAGPFGPTPEDGAEGIHPVGVVLQWGSTAKGFDHEVWFGDSPYGLTLIDTVSYAGSMSTALDPLQWETTYFWQIVATDGIDVFTGPMWSFTTIVPDCTEEIPGDANGDCQVDMEDLALVASSWLTCNREPQESCFE